MNVFDFNQRERERERERQTDRQTDRQTETDKQTDREVLKLKNCVKAEVAVLGNTILKNISRPISHIHCQKLVSLLCKTMFSFQFLFCFVFVCFLFFVPCFVCTTST